MSDRRLVINADDFGLAPGVDDGIIEAASVGIVTSVSVVTNVRHRDDIRMSVEAIKRVAPGVGIGLHFNCVMGSPLTECRTLTDRDGKFAPAATLIRRALLHRVDEAEITAECAAQLSVLQEIVGTVTHLDGHLHLHVLPVFWGVVNRVAAQFGVRHVRLPLEPFNMNPLDVAATVRKVLDYLAWRSAGGTGPYGGERIRFTGMSLREEAHFSSRLLRLFRNLPAGITELMVHPGHHDAALARFTGYVEPRANELVTLTSLAVRDRLSQENITLTSFGA